MAESKDTDPAQPAEQAQTKLSVGGSNGALGTYSLRIVFLSLLPSAGAGRCGQSGHAALHTS